MDFPQGACLLPTVNYLVCFRLEIENLKIFLFLSFCPFIPYIFIIQSKKNYRLCKTLKKIVLKSGENCFFATFSIFSLVSQGTNLVKTHIVATFCRKY